MQMRRNIRNGLVGLLVAGLAGCTGSMGTVDGSGGSPGGSGGNKGSGGGNGSGGSSSGSGGSSNGSGGSSNGSGGSSNGSGGGTGSGGTTVVTGCTPGIPSTTQVPRMTRQQYGQVVSDLLGATLPADTLADDSTGSLTDIMWTGYQTAANKIAAAVMADSTQKAKFMSCDASQAQCLTDTIKAFGRKAFRRPVTDAEVTAFMGLNSLTPAGKPAEVAEAILAAFLQSPSFIMLPELSQTKDSATGALKLTSYEVATRLSFLFWNSVPDDTLSMAADKDQLQTKEQIVAQAQRLITSTRAASVASTFHRAYVGFETGSHWVNGSTHNATKYPNFGGTSYSDSMAEIDSFFQDLLANNGSFKDIFLSSNAFVTKGTAALYGLNASDYTTAAKKTTLDATKRPGIFTRIGFLASFSHEDVTSPILRGAFITGRVLGIPLGTVDPKNAAMSPPMMNYTTNRQAIETLTMNAPCNGCHTTKINPPGFVLERYNAVGTWQDKDPLGGDINSTADVYLDATSAPKTLSTPLDLMTELSKSAVAQHVYAEKWVSYASGRQPNNNDACIVDTLTPNLKDGSYSISKMMADYTQADSFRLRTVGN